MHFFTKTLRFCEMKRFTTTWPLSYHCFCAVFMTWAVIVLYSSFFFASSMILFALIFRSFLIWSISFIYGLPFSLFPSVLLVKSKFFSYFFWWFVLETSSFLHFICPVRVLFMLTLLSPSPFLILATHSILNFLLKNIFFSIINIFSFLSMIFFYCSYFTSLY